MHHDSTHKFSRFALAAALSAVLIIPGDDKDFAPRVESASNEGKAAIAKMQLKQGMQITLFAAEPQLANPVSFCIDYQNNFYVAETFRLHKGVTDIRLHMDWCDDDLAAKTVEDRVALHKKHDKDNFDDYSKAPDRVRWLKDTDGDGIADIDKVFADGFNEAASGVGSGLLSYKGNVYYTCIPDLWMLRDNNSDGVADERKSLHYGYGVHIAMIGHDLHGLRIGPDRKLYFSCGDRGLNVKIPGGRVENHDTGAVLRCNLDGSDLEVFARGLRNPQELVFDEFGNLFTGDNNSDGGDRARFVHVVEGGDSGWRYGYQWLGDPHLRGPWNEEKLWHPQWEGQAAYIIPPIQWFANGPSGLTYYPGTGLSPEYKNHFFLCEFEGDPAWSGILSFTLKPKGATFDLGPSEKFIWNTLVTDCDFAPDGSLYFTDWVQGWEMTGKGRIYKATFPGATAENIALATNTAKLLSEGMAGRAVEELALLLEHSDQRVRQEAHFELAARGEKGGEALHDVLLKSKNIFARVHALWGLEIAQREYQIKNDKLFINFLADRAHEVRAQAARACGNLKVKNSAESLIKGLSDSSAPVRLQAAIALSKVGTSNVTEALFQLLIDAGQNDRALRHAAAMALAACATNEQLQSAAKHASADVRTGAVVALRRREDPAASIYLNDADARVVNEAARAIYDVPIEASLGDLTLQLQNTNLKEAPALRRALAAALRIGGEANIRAIAQFAMRADVSEALRLEALSHLNNFPAPGSRDAVTGEWRPIVRSEAEANDAKRVLSVVIHEMAADGFEKAPEAFLLQWAKLVAKYKINAEGERIKKWLQDQNLSAKLRGEALRTLVELHPPDLASSLTGALSDRALEVRVAALETIRKVIPNNALAAAQAALTQGSAPEMRAAFDIITDILTADSLLKSTNPEAEGILANWLTKLDASLAPAEASLEILEAAEKKWKDTIPGRMPRRKLAMETDPLIAPWLDSLYGGDAERGKLIFRNNNSLSCLRCHKTSNDDAGVVGPDLRGLSARSTRMHILEAIVDPNRKITNGYHSTVLELKDHTVISGRIESEDATIVKLRKPDNTLADVPAAEILERRPDISSMPEGLGKFINRREMRDLLEYLAGLK